MRTKRKNRAHGPYTTNWEHIEDEIRWVAARARRIAAEREVGNWLQEAHILEAHRASVPKVSGLRELERRLRRTIDLRLAATREGSPATELGLDRVAKFAEDQGLPLCIEERLLVLVALIPGLSRHVASQVFDVLGIHSWGRPSVEDAALLLDPQSPAEWANLRRFLRPSGTLLRSGILTLVIPGGEPGPESLMEASVALTPQAFALLIGDPEATSEVASKE